MSDYNWSSPTAIGAEWQPIAETSLQFASAGAGFAQRIRPGATTLTALHRYHGSLVGVNPGIALEVVDVLIPTTTTTSIFPGTDLGALTTTGWQTQAAGVATFANAASKVATTSYLDNSSALQTWEQRSIQFRGNGAALAGQRIAYIAMAAVVQCISYTNTTDIGVEALLNVGGSSYYGPIRRVQNNAIWYTPLLGVWRLNPNTNLPWTQADINLLIQTGGTNNFGLRVSYPRPSAIGTAGFRIAGVWFDVVYATENRYGYYYDSKKTLTNWQRFAVSGGAALSANAWYWLVEYPLIGGAGNFAGGVVHTDPKVVVAATAAATVGEHRETLAVSIANGLVTGVYPDARTVQNSAVTQGVPGQLFGGTLLEAAGPTILSQSNPYVLLERRKIATDSTLYIGQQITGAAATAYGSVQLPVAWDQAGVRPDQPLVVEVRHGAGALTGGGTLDATATLYPDDIDGTLQRKQVPFAVAFTSLLNTQYFVLIKSGANTNTAWDVVRLDTHSDQIDPASTTTIANIEGASQGGQADSYAENGTALTRYDIPITMIAAPSPPAGFTVTVKAGVTSLLPPRVQLSWTATTLGAAFRSYRIYRRPSRTPVKAWELLFEVAVNPGQTAATVEANNTTVTDYEAGWARGQWNDGWDYAISVLNANTGIESPLSTASTRNILTADLTDAWITSNIAPYLNAPVWASSLDGQDVGTLTRYAALGRDLAVTRSRRELPARTYKIAWDSFQSLGEDGIRFQRAAALSGRQVALMVPSGDRVIGSLDSPATKQNASDLLDSSSTFIETSRTSAVADCNAPCGLTFNGTSQTVTVADNALINPLAGACTIILCAGLGGLVGAGNKAFLSKGNIYGFSTGYGFFGSDGAVDQINAYFNGASGAVNTAAIDPTTFDGNLHVLIGTTTGTNQALYRDGTLLATSAVTHGSITNTVALSVGADNGGTTVFTAITPFQSAAYYPRVLTAAEILAATNYLLGYPNNRMPSGANLFVDLRDQRTWNGLSSTFNDLSGNGLNGTAVAAPPARGLPVPLANLDRF